MEGGLPLDDPRWPDLHTRNGAAAWVPAWLERLYANPHDAVRLPDGWPALCSEGTTWSAAYAAFPHLVRIAARVPPADRLEYVVVLGFIVKDRVRGDPAGPMGLRSYLAADFRASIAPARQLAAEVLGVTQPNERELRYGLVAVAALHGYHAMAECIDRLDDGEVCPPYAEALAGATSVNVADD